MNKDSNFTEIFPWDVNFETGIEEIDVQHKELLKILNNLAAHLANLSEIPTLDGVFDELIAYTDYHFKTEEKIWKKYFKGDTAYIEHQSTHNSFIYEVIKLRENTQNTPHEEMIRNVVGFLSKWLAYHILDTDKEMAKTVIAIDKGATIDEAKIIAQKEMSGSTRVLIDTVLNMYNTLSSTTMDLMREKTLRIRAQEELQKRHKELEKLLQIQSRQASMGEMISMITHQWKQPITVLSMITNNIYMDIEMDSISNDALKKDVEQISEQIKYLSTTIDDFRDYFKSNKTLEKLYPNEFMDNLLKIIGKSLEHHKIKLDINIINEFSFTSYKNELTQVILNILNNAKDVLIENNISNASIKIEIFKNKDKIFINIQDNGCGIKDDVNKIFEAYFTTKKEDKGTGLGLYIVKDIVEKHLQGEISAQNNSTGALFKIEIPAEME